MQEGRSNLMEGCDRNLRQKPPGDHGVPAPWWVLRLDPKNSWSGLELY